MSDHVSGEELIRNLELAADVFLSPQTDEEQRKQAERYFLDFKNAKLSFDVSRHILEHCANEFVLFQVVSALKETVVREWRFLSDSLISGLCEYLLTFVTRPGLSNSVVAEILQTVAVIAKRDTFDKKSIDAGRLFDLASEWISSGTANLQSLACQLLVSVCSEYCTSWRSRSIGLAWDFHVRAKRAFEENGLRRVFQLCLQVLHHLLNSIPSLCDSSHGYDVLTARLLHVAESVLNWNFGSTLLPKRITFTLEFSPAVCFQPGPAWTDLLVDANVVPFLFELYSKVKMHQELGSRVLQCLVPLASLTGWVFTDDNAKGLYLFRFVSCITDMLRDGNQMVQPITLIISQIALKLSIYFPANLLFASPENVVIEYLTQLTRLTCYCDMEAVKESIDDCESVYEETYENLLTFWSNLLEKSENVACLLSPCQKVFASYLRAHLASPDGYRPLAVATDDREVSEAAEDDRDRYMEVLKRIGKIGRQDIDTSAEQLYKLLLDRVQAFCRHIALLQQPDSVKPDDAALAAYQEDMHWLLLVTGSFLVEQTPDVVKIPEEIPKWSIHCGMNFGDCTVTAGYLEFCITSPLEEMPGQHLDRNHVIRLIGVTLRWAAIEHQIISDGTKNDQLSPQVAQTTLWWCRRLLMAYNLKSVDAEYRESPLSKQLGAGVLVKPLACFALQKALKILAAWGGEVHLVKDAVSLVTTIAESRQRVNELGVGTNLALELQKVDVRAMSPLSRCGLLQCLVAISASTDLGTVQQEICATILEPLGARFHEIKCSLELRGSASKEEVVGPLLELFDCISGVVKSMTPRTAQTIFRYLNTVFETSPTLINYFKDDPPVLDTLLELYVDLSNKALILSEATEQFMQFVSYLMALFNAYAANNKNGYKCRITAASEEEKVNDLLLLLQIITNVVSKNIFTSAEPEGPLCDLTASFASFAFDILTPLISNELIKYPSLPAAYFKAVAKFVEANPVKFCQMNEHTLESIFLFITGGVAGEYGTEVSKLSLDTLNLLATFVSQCTENYCIPVRNVLWRFIKPVFERCLDVSGEASPLTDAATSLYALICCGQFRDLLESSNLSRDSSPSASCMRGYNPYWMLNGCVTLHSDALLEVQYKTMVQEIVSSHSDPAVQEKLTNAFRSLLPEHVTAQPFRREKRFFRDRFESFLNEVQGLLCLYW